VGSGWPRDARELERLQHELAALRPAPYRPGPDPLIAGVYVCFARGTAGPGADGDRGWAGAAACRAGALVRAAVAEGRAGAPYDAGFLALREGPLLDAAVRALDIVPDVLLVNATGRDHPRRAGLALHLGALLGVPTVGVTHRPLLAAGEWPEDRHGEWSPVRIDEEVAGAWVRTREGVRPLVAHPAWRTDLGAAVRILLSASGGVRTPLPVREARRLARAARSACEGRAPIPRPA
jgi:deoxyribonuclease V